MGHKLEYEAAWREGRDHAETRDDSIPRRTNAGSPEKADERQCASGTIDKIRRQEIKTV